MNIFNSCKIHVGLKNVEFLGGLIIQNIGINACGIFEAKTFIFLRPTTIVWKKTVKKFCQLGPIYCHQDIVNFSHQTKILQFNFIFAHGCIQAYDKLCFYLVATRWCLETLLSFWIFFFFSSNVALGECLKRPTNVKHLAIILFIAQF